MRDYAIVGALVALIANNEILTLALLTIAVFIAVAKLFAAAAERSW